MNKPVIITAVAAALIGGLAGRYVLPANPASAHQDHAVDAGAVSKRLVWTCSMHPQIQQPEPGPCPICGMDLIPLADDSGPDTGPRTMSMSESSRALADIQTSIVVQEYATKTVHLVGKITYDQTLEKALTARFPARIDDLHVNYTGITVKTGEHLADIYSAELLTAQSELLTASRSNAHGTLVQAARDKLLLWDLLPAQIDEIIDRGTASDHFTLLAPIGGVVVTKNVEEGNYVKTGEPLFRIADLGHLWLHLDAFESDLPWLRFGQEVIFTVEAYPGETFEGQISFITPEVDPRNWA